MTETIYVIKASGEQELFNEQKLVNSIKHAGIPSPQIPQAIQYIRGKLTPGISTQQIHEYIIGYLGQYHVSSKIKFNLKQALMELGPSGYPFEKYISAILNAQGYQTQTNVRLEGKCVAHEVDVVATKDNEKYLIECKYHNLPGSRSDVKVPLYVKSRFEDLLSHGFTKAWIITNTKFTSDVIKFSLCAGIKITGWGYPSHENLQYLIEATGLHPITCQNILNKKQTLHLLSQNIVLCRDLLTLNPSLIASAEIQPDQISRLKSEVQLMANHHSHD